MTTRQFDPVFSAALRNELESIVETGDAPERPHRPVRTALAKPQLWVSLVTAILLAVVTVGVLRITHASEPADPVKSIDPMAQITDPTGPNYVARSVTVLAAFRGTGTGTTAFDVAPSVRSIRVYLTCTPSGHFSTSIDGSGESSGGCDKVITSSFDMPVKPGSHTVSADVAKRTRFSVLVIATPAPTISTGSLIDPLSAVRDLRNPDALTGDTTPVLHATASGSGGIGTVDHRPGVRLRAYFVCLPGSADAVAVVGGHRMPGCMNSIAHWLDFTPTTSRIGASVTAPAATAWSILVVPAPPGAKDSPATTALAYPEAPGTRLGAARGSGAAISGTYRRVSDSLLLTTTCRGTGWLEIQLGDGSGTNSRGQACSTARPSSVGMGGGTPSKKTLRWSVIPHGDITWTFQLTADD